MLLAAFQIFSAVGLIVMSFLMLRALKELRQATNDLVAKTDELNQMIKNLSKMIDAHPINMMAAEQTRPSSTMVH